MPTAAQRLRFFPFARAAVRKPGDDGSSSRRASSMEETRYHAKDDAGSTSTAQGARRLFDLRPGFLRRGEKAALEEPTTGREEPTTQHSSYNSNDEVDSRSVNTTDKKSATSWFSLRKRWGADTGADPSAVEVEVQDSMEQESLPQSRGRAGLSSYFTRKGRRKPAARKPVPPERFVDSQNLDRPIVSLT